MASPTSSTTDALKRGRLQTAEDAKPSGSDYDSIIRVRVGKDDEATGSESQTFELYKGVLRFYSGYFRAAIDNIESDRFTEAEDGFISLPDEDPELFEVFKDWIYTRSLVHTGPGNDTAGLIRLWCFGDRRVVPLLQNDTMNYMYADHVSTRSAGFMGVHHAWENTSPESALRRYMTFVLTRVMTGPIPEDNREHFSEDVLWDILAATREKPPVVSMADFAKIDMCEYHFHEAGERCANTTTAVTASK